MRGGPFDGPIGRHRRGGGGRGRQFEQGELRFVLLRLIAETPRHGYELIKAIEDSLGGVYSPSPGVIYPTLTLLEELGYATITTNEGGKKLYAATPEGTAHLEANRDLVDGIFQRMQQSRASFAAPQVLRAMENLKLALRLKLAETPHNEDRIRGIVAVLDAAVVEIERL